ncbi:hypothetical protein B0H13DRAFT_2069798 [Mycena leptocephala]|nr:hypothetical protein B0H13DRAFT_2069798 [Mycena leptocephala]
MSGGGSTRVVSAFLIFFWWFLCFVRLRTLGEGDSPVDHPASFLPFFPFYPRPHRVFFLRRPDVLESFLPSLTSPIPVRLPP